MPDAKTEIWFIRNIPRALRQRVTDAAKARRQSLGELVSTLLDDGLARLEAVGGSAPDRNIWEEIDRLSERMAALEARGARGGRSGGATPGKATGSRQRRSERAEKPIAEDRALFIGDGAGRRLTAAGEDEVMRLYQDGKSKKSIGRAIGISDRTVAAVIARTRAPTDGHL